MLPDHPLPVVSVTIDRAEMLFGIDTGAMGSGRISAAAANELRLRPAGQRLISDPSGRNPQSVNVYQAPSLALGAVRFLNVEIEETNRLPPGLAGILGLDLFAGFVLTLDAPGRSLGLARGGLPQADGRSVFQSPPGPAIRVPLRIGEHALDADIDTGQVLWPLLVSEAAARALPLTGETRSGGVGRTVSGEYELFVRSLSAEAWLGETRLDIADVAWPSPTPTANLGWRAFAGRALRIDSAARRCALAP
jgi:hypothetical protein